MLGWDESGELFRQELAGVCETGFSLRLSGCHGMELLLHLQECLLYCDDGVTSIGRWCRLHGA